MNTSRGQKYIFFIFLVVVFWNILDFIYSTLITKSGYNFTFDSNIGLPLVVGVVVGYLILFRNDKV